MRHSNVNHWKTWLLALLAFTGICLLADVTVTRGLRNPLADENRIEHLYQENPGEIPIFGNSKAHAHYDPRAMGLNAFNYGIDGASFEVTDVLLQIELAKAKTSPVIIELQHRDTGLLTDEAKFIPFVRDDRVAHLLRHFDALDWKYYVPGLRYFGHYNWYFQDWLWERIHMTKVFSGFGDHKYPLVFNRAYLDRHIVERLKVTNGYFQDENQERRLIAHIQGHPERLFFLMVSPSHPSYFVRFLNLPQWEAYKARLSALPNVVLIDWGQLDYPEEYFGDTLHLQWKAVGKYSKMAGDRIREEIQKRNGQPSGVSEKSAP